MKHLSNTHAAPKLSRYMAPVPGPKTGPAGMAKSVFQAVCFLAPALCLMPSIGTSSRILMRLIPSLGGVAGWAPRASQHRTSPITLNNEKQTPTANSL